MLWSGNCTGHMNRTRRNSAPLRRCRPRRAKSAQPRGDTRGRETVRRAWRGRRRHGPGGGCRRCRQGYFVPSLRRQIRTGHRAADRPRAGAARKSSRTAAPSTRIWSAHRRLRPRARYWAQACHFWHRHVRPLLNAVPDPHAAAHTLPATLSAEHVTVLLRELGEHRELTPRSLRSRSAAASPTVSRRD